MDFKKYLFLVLLFAATALLTYHFVVRITPMAVLLVIKYKGGAELNEPYYADMIRDDHRNVPIPNPDFLYTGLGYDVRKGPIVIEGEMPDTSYFSLALYDLNTRNFYIKNDRDCPEKKFKIVLKSEGDGEVLPSDAEVVMVPDKIGAAFVRILVTDSSQLTELKRIQKTFHVTTLY